MSVTQNSESQRPSIFRWEEGASLVRASVNLVAQQLAWSGYFFLSAGINRGDNIPIADVDAAFVAKAFLAFGFDIDMLERIVNKTQRLQDWPPLQKYPILWRVQDAFLYAKSLHDPKVHSLLILFLIHLDSLLNSGVLPSCPLDLYYLSKVIVNAVSPISYVEAILQGEDFRDLLG